MAVVDIGAGTGDSYWLVRNTKYNFSKYYFVEPFGSMIEKFGDKNHSDVVIVNDYLESETCSAAMSEDRNRKVFIMCASLRTIDQMGRFLGVLKKEMQKGDVFFLAIEPNNEYFGKYYKFMMPLLFSKRVYRKVKSILLRISSPLKRGAGASVNGFDSLHTLDKSLKHLQEKKVVNDKFTREMLYAMVYYNNYLCWRNIDIPENHNDGFFTIEQVAEALDCKISDFSTRTYLYGADMGFEFADGMIEKGLHFLAPRHGSTFSATLVKK